MVLLHLAPVRAEGLTPAAPAPAVLNVHMTDDERLVMNTLPVVYGWSETGICEDPAADVVFLIPLASLGALDSNFTINGQSRFHLERGLARDIHLRNASVNVQVRIPIDTPPMPDFYVVADVLGHEPSGGSSNLADEPKVAHGQSAPQVVLPSTAVQQLAMAFSLDLVANATLAKTGQVVLALTLHTGLGCQATRAVALTSFEDHRTRLEFTIADPVYFEFIHPEVAAGILLIHTAANSPFGTEDLDAQNMTVTIDGPSKPRELPVVVAQNSHVHNLHDKAAEVTWIWRFRDEGAASGDYTINVTASNRQHTATANGQASFHIDAKGSYGIDDRGQTVSAAGDPGAKASPTQVAGAVAALAFALLLSARRRNPQP